VVVADATTVAVFVIVCGCNVGETWGGSELTLSKRAFAEEEQAFNPRATSKQIINIWFNLSKKITSFYDQK
jgi:hypothetical protein